MTGGAQPILERPALRVASRSQSQTAKPSSSLALRLPEDRAFDVATINRRLARTAEQAAPPRRR